jgi:hypothetical protein
MALQDAVDTAVRHRLLALALKHEFDAMSVTMMLEAPDGSLPRC